MRLKTKVGVEAKKILRKSLNSQNRKLPRKLNTDSIYMLEDRNNIILATSFSQDDLIKKILYLASELKEDKASGMSRIPRQSIIFGKESYIDVITQNNLKKSETSYNKINSHKNIEAYVKKLLKMRGANELKENPVTKSYLKDTSLNPSILIVSLLKTTPRKQALEIGKSIFSTTPKLGYAFNTFETGVVMVPWYNLHQAKELLEKKILKFTFKDSKMYAGNFSAEVHNKDTNQTYSVDFGNAALVPTSSDFYRDAWTVYMNCTCDDFKKTSKHHKKQKKQTMVACKHIISANDEAKINYSGSYEARGPYTAWNGLFLMPNSSFINVAEVLNMSLVVREIGDKKIELLPLSETMKNQTLDRIIINTGLAKLTEKN